MEPLLDRTQSSPAKPEPARADEPEHDAGGLLSLAQTAPKASAKADNPLALAPKLLRARAAVDVLALVAPTFLPAYRRAADALDAMAVLELARHIVGAVQRAEDSQQELGRVADAGPGAFLVSIPGQPEQSEKEIDGQLAEIEKLRAQLVESLPTLEADLAIKLGPQIFRGAPVGGSLETPALGKRPADLLASESGALVELLLVVAEVRKTAGLDGRSSPALDDSQRAAIVALVEPWKSRPVNFSFLAAVLGQLGIWESVATQAGPSGKTLAATQFEVEDQVRQTGALTDVGELDAATLSHLLGADPTDHYQPFDDTAAMAVFEKLHSAAPAARAVLLRQIQRWNMLDQLCEHLPFKLVEALHDGVWPHDREIARALEPFFEDKGGGKSLHRMYMEQVDHKLEAGQTIRAFGWFFLDFVHNALTGGFAHEYGDAYDAHEQGLTTDDEFSSASTKALAKAAAVTALSAVTAGVTGELAQGLAAGLGAGKSVAQLIGAGAGGFGAGVSGHFAGDVFDQAFNGKEGFDSGRDYLKSGALGAGMGMAGAELARLSVGAGKYLGLAERPIDAFASRYPAMSEVLERIRLSGVRAGSRVRMKVSELLDVIGSGFGGPGGPNAFAFATVYGGLEKMPRDIELDVRLRPARSKSLTAPMKMGSGRGPDDAEGGAGARAAHEADLEPVIELEDADIVEITDEAGASSTLQSSGDSLDPFLDRVWAARAGIHDEMDVYRLYMDPSEAKAPLTGDANAYMDRLAELNRGRKGKSSVQGSMERGFWRYAREGRVSGGTQERIYVNVAADHAVEVMEMVVKEIVDNPKFPKATLAKVAGPKAVATREDALVIYTEDAVTADLVIEHLRAYREAHPDFFEATSPPMTDQVLEGVSVGYEPLGGGSFGMARSKAIREALDLARMVKGGRKVFGNLARMKLNAHQIDPVQPHRNKPGGGE